MATLAEQIGAKRREILIETLVRTHGNRTAAARELGVTARQIFRMIAEELTTYDMSVIADKCSESGGIDPKSSAGAVRA